jgi:hypothetical protein
VTSTAEPAQEQLASRYTTARLRQSATVQAAVAAAWAAMYSDRSVAIKRIVELVLAGQRNTVALVEAYLATETLLVTGEHASHALDPASYTIDALRGVAAAEVYARPFGAYGAFRSQGAEAAQAIEAARASVSKLAATDLQLAQTHAARDWMQAEPRIVGYRRVLNLPSCALCTAASTRTYRKADLLPIHEHCDCTVAPLFGTAPVASVGTKVRVQNDPEIGPRLMADDWSPVGPRLITYEEG